jgi:hypothetical protein
MVKQVVGLMQAISNELKEAASACYTDEEAVEGNFVTRISFEVDKLAELLDQTSLECHVALEDTLAADKLVDDNELWEEVFFWQDRMNDLPPLSLVEH